MHLVKLKMRGPIARSTARTSGVLGARLIAQAGTLLIVARVLGPLDYGVFAGVAAMAVMLGTLSSFGMQIVLLADVSREPKCRDDILPFALTTTMICGSVLFASYLLLATMLMGNVDVGIGTLAALGLAELLLQPLLNLAGSEYQGQGRIATSQLLISLPVALRLIAALVIWALHPSNALRDYAWGYFCASGVALGLATYNLQQPWPGLRTWRLPKIKELRRAAGYAVMNLTAAGPGELDKALALNLLPLAAAGVYAAGARVIGALTLPVIALMVSAIPRLFSESATGTRRPSQLLRWLFGATLIYGVVLASILWVSAPLLESLFGSRYQALPELVRWLCPAVPGLALRIAAGGALMALGSPWMRVLFELVGMLLLATVAFLLAPHFGIYAMPIAMTAAEWTMTICGGLMLLGLRRAGEHHV